MSILEFNGECPICEKKTSFTALGTWFRDELICNSCNSIPRERALAHILSRMRPEWRSLLIHESSPADRGVSKKLASQAIGYFPSQYYPAINDAMVGKFFNINIESQLFESEIFDVFISLDVFEHVFDPRVAIQEIYRTLKPGGIALLTFPINKAQVDALTFRASLEAGVITFLKPAEYHGNPIDELGSLVTVDYGYEIHQRFSEWSNFNIEIVRFNRPDIGVLGEFTEVVICQK